MKARRGRTWAILAAGTVLALAGAGCNSSSSPAPSRSAGTATSAAHDSPTPAASPTARSGPCPRGNVCFKHGTVQANVSGATTAALSAALDDHQTYVNLPQLITLIYTNPKGEEATVGVMASQPGTYPKGVVKVLFPGDRVYVGFCTVSVQHLSRAGADGSFACSRIGTLFGPSAGTVSVTGTFSASP
jgi:hypothetical protein